MKDHDEPDMRGPAIVVDGSVLGGFEFHGPFETIDEAIRWFGTTLPAKLGRTTTIALLERPVWPSAEDSLPVEEQSAVV